MYSSFVNDCQVIDMVIIKVSWDGQGKCVCVCVGGGGGGLYQTVIKCTYVVYWAVEITLVCLSFFM